MQVTSSDAPWDDGARRFGISSREAFRVVDGRSGWPCLYLATLDGGESHALLRGTFYEPALFGLRLVRGGPVHLEPLANELATRFSNGRVRILTWSTAGFRAFNASLLAAGFLVERTKLFVERRLEGYEAPTPSRLTFRSLAEVDEETFVSLLAAVREGDPFEEGETASPRERFDEEVAAAGPAFDPHGWLVAHLDHRIVGLTLAQRYPDRPTEGTQQYVGLLPAWRRKGLGRELHAAGLAVLARAGVERYVGSTDERNEAMARTFAANGCEVSKKQLFLRKAVGSRSPVASHLA